MKATDPTLFIFSGLPGAGKSTLAKLLSARLNCVYLRIDTIEQGLRELCHVNVEGEGYRLAYRLAADNLRTGNNVVADSVNPITLTRDEWQDVARRSGANYVNIEVVCADRLMHQSRVESRESEVEGLQLPTWQQVLEREYDPWDRPRIVVDTSFGTAEECLQRLLAELG